jgi:hypothetical protein
MLLETGPIERVQRIAGGLRVKSESISGDNIIDSNGRGSDATLLKFLFDLFWKILERWTMLLFLVDFCHAGRSRNREQTGVEVKGYLENSASRAVRV